METILSTQNKKKFQCESCDFKCSKKSYWERHIITAKHLRLTKVNTLVSPIQLEVMSYSCSVCNKEYKSRVGLWKHSKKCIKHEPLYLNESIQNESIQNESIQNESIPTKIQYIKNEHLTDEPISADISFLTNLVLEVVKNNTELQKQNTEFQKQNQEFQKQMMELCKKGNTIINNTNNTNNSHNKTFNLQFFLNEQCKDAMNLMDFVDSMTLEFSDLEDVGKLGYVEGISNIIIRKLNELDIYKRPIHCSDGKREIMYVRDDNVWEKENNTYDKIRKAIKRVSFKNSSMLVPWSKEHPQCMNTQHHLNDVYVKMIGQAMGGKEEFVDSENKIMKKIAKAVLIDKA